MYVYVYNFTAQIYYAIMSTVYASKYNYVTYTDVYI